MKKIDLYLGRGFYSDGNKVFLNGEEFFDLKFKANFKKFSLLILYARKFNLKNLLILLDVFSTPIINDVVVVVGDKREEKKVREIEFLNGKVVINPDPKDVLYSSLKIGLKAVSRRTDFLILHFGTLYKIGKETIDRIIEKSLTTKKEILIPTYKERKGHPIVFSRSIIPLLASLRKEKGLPYLLKHYGEKIEYFNVEDKNILRR